MRKWIPGLLVAGAFAASAILWPRLPSAMPLHWNLRGDVDGWGTRWQGALLLPTIALAVWLLLAQLPRIDPRRESYPKFRESYDLVVLASVLFLVALHGAVLASALGAPVPMSRVMPIGVGLLLITIGNVLPRTRPNWWLGVRTPWTLSNDRVWARTHRVAGFLMVGAGVVVALSSALPATWGLAVLLCAVAFAALGSIAYSWVAWKEETTR